MAVLAASVTAEARPRVRVDGTIRAMDFSADGDWLAVGYDAGDNGQIALYHARYSRRSPIDLPQLGAPIAFVGFAGGGKLLAALSSTGRMRVFTVPDGREIYNVDLAKRAGGEGASARAFAHPDQPYVGWLLLPKGDEVGKLEVARVPGGQVVTSLTKVRSGDEVRWSRDGRYLLVDGTALSWDTFERWSPKVGGVTATSSDGSRVVSTSPTRCDGFLTIAEPTTGKVLRSIPIGRDACPAWIRFSKDDRGLLWIGADGTGDDAGAAIYVWDERRDRQRRLDRLELDPKVTALSADRRILAVSDGESVRYHWLR